MNNYNNANPRGDENENEHQNRNGNHHIPQHLLEHIPRPRDVVFRLTDRQLELMYITWAAARMRVCQQVYHPDLPLHPNPLSPVWPDERRAMMTLWIARERQMFEMEMRELEYLLGLGGAHKCGGDSFGGRSTKTLSKTEAALVYIYSNRAVAKDRPLKSILKCQGRCNCYVTSKDEVFSTRLSSAKDWFDASTTIGTTWGQGIIPDLEPSNCAGTGYRCDSEGGIALSLVRLQVGIEAWVTTANHHYE
ncbi:uncharacterized protein F5147DRAFT_652569 [Suillus discolor]|uniref:Uncharacterized protein n=1 Tax=Suillus discolor TaxID=1912936 RepID=A0A9P7F6T4_9AGAM|nr:uncharacterized protein F5147DRAFT_652569 [Suillus discolor]KAG2108991.1 hypothetical protein F5147DRAFT_652569 [Suillus discolor]